MNRISPKLLRPMWSKTLFFGLAVAAAAVSLASHASAEQTAIGEGRPAFNKLRQVGDVLEAEFHVPKEFDFYHVIVHGPGQSSAQRELHGNGFRTFRISNLSGNRKYSISVQGVRKATNILSKDTCSPWVERSITTHEIAQEITFGKRMTEAADVVVYYQLNDKWHFKSFRLEAGIPFESSGRFQVLTDNTTLYWYAKGVTSGKVWTGNHNYAYNGKTLGFRQENTGSGWSAKSITLKE